jgi:hypothetical protein
MARVGRVLLWTVVLVAPGGFLLVPVLAATSLASTSPGARSHRERFTALLSEARLKLSSLHRYWTKR